MTAEVAVATRRPDVWFAITASARMQARQNLSHAMTYATGILNPLMFLAVLVLPRAEPLSGTETTQVLTGTTLAAFWAASVWGGVGVLRRERWNGTLARSVTGVQDARWVLMGKVAGAGALNLAVVIASLAAGSLLFGLRPQVEHPLALALGLVATLVSGTAAAQLIGALLLITRHGVALSSAMGTPITLLGGTILPLALLPEPVRWLSRAISLSWLQDFLASTAHGSLDWGALAAAALVTAVYAVAGWRVFTALLDRSRREATLDLL